MFYFYQAAKEIFHRNEQKPSGHNVIYRNSHNASLRQT